MFCWLLESATARHNTTLYPFLFWHYHIRLCLSMLTARRMNAFESCDVDEFHRHVVNGATVGATVRRDNRGKIAWSAIFPAVIQTTTAIVLQLKRTTGPGSEEEVDFNVERIGFGVLSMPRRAAFLLFAASFNCWTYKPYTRPQETAWFD